MRPAVERGVKRGIERIVLVGACIIDNILNVPHYPAEDEKLRCNSFTRRCGGNTPNTAEVLKQLLELQDRTKSIELVLVSVLPARDSEASKFIAASLGPKVNLEHCIHRLLHDEAISSYIISSAASDTRTIVTHNDMPDMTFEEFVEVIKNLNKDPKATLFHFEGRNVDVVSRCMAHINSALEKKEHCLHAFSNSPNFISLISVELEKPGRPGLEDLVQHASVVFYSKAWAQHKGYKGAHECLTSQRKFSTSPPLHLVCTWGEKGSWASEDRDPVVHAPAQEATVVDPVGAGDTFIAAFLFSVFITHDGIGAKPRTRLAFANWMAARKISQDGFAGLFPTKNVDLFRHDMIWGPHPRIELPEWSYV